MIGSLNVRGLKASVLSKRISPKLLFLKNIFKSQKSFLFALTETNLEDKDFWKIKVPTPFRKLGSTGNGRGTGILLLGSSDLSVTNKTVVKGRILHSKVTCETNPMFNNLDIFSVYMPTGAEPNKFNVAWRHLIHYLGEQEDLGRIILLGDFNTDPFKMEHASRESRIQALAESFLLEDAGIKFKNPAPTWIGAGERHKSSSRLDRIFFPPDYKCDTFLHKSCYKTDHFFIGIGNQQPKPKSTPKWNMTVFNHSEFIALATESCNKSLINSSLDAANYNEYVRNIRKCDTLDFPCTDTQKSYIPVFDYVNSNLLIVADKFHKKSKSFLSNRCKDYEKKVANLKIKALQAKDDTEIDELKTVEKEFATFFKEHLQQISNRNFENNLIKDGKSNTYTFRRFNKKPPISHSFNVDGSVINDQDEIGKMFDEHMRGVAGPATPSESEMNEHIKEFEQFFGQKFESFCKVGRPPSIEITLSEIKSALKTMSANSAKGVSGQGKALINFYLTYYPNFFVQYINELIRFPSDQSFLKIRKIIFLNKKPDPQSPKDFRPISLCEFIYKLVSKILSNKIKGQLNSLISCNQFGFCKGRQLSSASFSAVSLINFAKDHGGTIVSLDVAAAFDKASWFTMRKCAIIAFGEKFANIWADWCESGQAFVDVGGVVGGKFGITQGCGQGDPSSSLRYLLIHNVFLAALQSKPLIHMYPPTLCGGGGECERAPILAFADDTLLLLKNLTYSQVLKISYALSLIAKVTGLAVNPIKSKILCKGDSPVNLNLLGEKVSLLKHLGIYLSFSWNEAYDSLYAEILSKLKKKANKLKFYTKDNVLKRKMIISAFLESQVLHVMRIFPPRPDQANKMQKLIEKAIWGGGGLKWGNIGPSSQFQKGGWAYGIPQKDRSQFSLTPWSARWSTHFSMTIQYWEEWQTIVKPPLKIFQFFLVVKQFPNS